MPGTGDVITVNAASSQWAETIRMAFGFSGSVAGRACSEASSFACARRKSPSMYGPGPPAWERKKVGCFMMDPRLGPGRLFEVQAARRHRSKRLNGADDNPRPILTTPQDTDDALRPDRVEDYFRDGDAPADALLWW